MSPAPMIRALKTWRRPIGPTPWTATVAPEPKPSPSIE